MVLKIKNMEEFSIEVEKLVNTKDLSYIEAVIEHLGSMGLEIENNKVKNLISPKIQKKMYEEALEYNMFRRKKKRHKLFED